MMWIRHLLGIAAPALSTAAFVSSALPDAATPGAVDPAVTQANIHQTHDARFSLPAALRDPLRQSDVPGRRAQD